MQNKELAEKSSATVTIKACIWLYIQVAVFLDGTIDCKVVLWCNLSYLWQRWPVFCHNFHKWITIAQLIPIWTKNWQSNQKGVYRVAAAAMPYRFLKQTLYRRL